MHTLVRRSNNNGQQVGGQAAKTKLFHRLKLITSTAVLVVATLPGAKASDISFVNAFKNLTSNQTGNGNTLTAAGGFFSAAIFANVGNAYTSANMVFPGPTSPVPLVVSPTDNTFYSFQTGSFATQAAMDAAFPFGTYTYNGINGGGTDTTSYSYTADHYATSSPFLTGTDFSSLQGMNTAQAFTVHFSPFNGAVSGPISSSFIFFTVFDFTKNMSVFDAGFLPTNTASVTIPANTLTAGDSFAYELDFSNRFGIDTLNTDFPAQFGFDVRTDGTFTAAAAVAATPEPSTMVLLGGGLLVASLIRRRKGSAV
jgi:hypothetical protein